MEIKIFVFDMDNHYGYPESREGSEPNSYSDLLKAYRNAGCSGYNMDNGDTEEPERDDFETDEEYKESMNEWEEANNENASGMFSDYGNFDVFHNLYILVYDPKYNIDVDDVINNYVGQGDDKINVHEDFMKDISSQEGVSFIISTGQNNGIEINGDSLETISSPSNDSFEKIADVILDMHKKGKPRAGLIYRDIVKIYPDFDNLISAALSPDEYKKLKELGKGGSALRRFGLDI